MNLDRWEKEFEALVGKASHDPAHDIAHFQRVVATAKRLAAEENACLEVVVPGAWLHDLVNVPKDDPRRSMASRLSASAGLQFLSERGYPAEYLDAIGHVIEAHSYSAQITALTTEAKIVQDADRLDGLGAIGIARCFSVSGLLRRRLYDPADPFGEKRKLDDLINTVDHFYVKLFNTVNTLQTRAGQAEGRLRAEHMRSFLEELGREIGISARS